MPGDQGVSKSSIKNLMTINRPNLTIKMMGRTRDATELAICTLKRVPQAFGSLLIQIQKILNFRADRVIWARKLRIFWIRLSREPKACGTRLRVQIASSVASRVLPIIFMVRFGLFMVIIFIPT